jgi:N-methylhydantoinase A/oxoprolinase/acetone carboxylase beta subunit
MIGKIFQKVFSMASLLYLGIDTGGTFTDGVLLDPHTRQVVRKAKVLTSHHDLTICIEGIFEALAPEDPQTIQLVSLSTTLATNAIAEGKRRPAALFLLGYDPELVYKFGFQDSFATDAYFFIDGRMDLEGREQVPLDEAGLLAQAESVRERVEALAVSAYAGPMNASQEERAAELLANLTGMPVVQGNHLSSRIGSIQRATTASLNASLLGDAYEFVAAVRQMLAKRQIHCPLIVVRGDGSLAAADFAVHRPVEIIHSGPATSAIGGRYLAGVDDALVVDVGGTTTDLALVEDGRTRLNDGAATVGNYHTSVRTIQARSFGLGGDSLVRFDSRGGIAVGPERVIPLSHLAAQHPEVKEDLLAWLEGEHPLVHADRVEYWILRREPKQPFSDPRTNRVIELLREGPRRMPDLLKKIGVVSPVLVDAELLFRRELIDRACLTPTDLMHVSGEFAPWDTEVARRVVDAAARTREQTPDEFMRGVKDWIKRKITAEIVQFLSGCSVPEETSHLKKPDLGAWVFKHNLHPGGTFLRSELHLDVPLVGIGAPAGYFLPEVAEALHTRLILPEHYEVANAVGTVVADVMVRHEAEVTPYLRGTTIAGYAVRGAGRRREFETREEAVEFAREALSRKVLEEAHASGAHAAVLELQEEEQAAGILRLNACAFGSPDGKG